MKNKIKNNIYLDFLKLHQAWEEFNEARLFLSSINPSDPILKEFPISPEPKIINNKIYL